jgi:chromosome segregation ATPase
MKSNLLAIALLLICLALGAVVWMQNQHHAVQANDQDQEFTNKYSKLEDQYAQQLLVNKTLETNLMATQIEDAKKLAEAESNRSATFAKLQEAQDEAKAAKAAVDKAAAQILDKEKRIAELERTNMDLDKEALSLRKQVSTLDAQIAEAKKQLDGSQGENRVLKDELTQLEAKKEDLERRLSDITALKAQVRTLQDNLSTARRITWLDKGVYNSIGQKGGQLLISPSKPSPPDTNKSLNVELHQGGGFNIITNAPSTNPPAPAAPSAR